MMAVRNDRLAPVSGARDQPQQPPLQPAHSISPDHSSFEIRHSCSVPIIGFFILPSPFYHNPLKTELLP